MRLADEFAIRQAEEILVVVDNSNIFMGAQVMKNGQRPRQGKIYQPIDFIDFL